MTKKFTKYVFPRSTVLLSTNFHLQSKKFDRQKTQMSIYHMNQSEGTVDRPFMICTFNVMVGSLEFLSTVYNSSISFFPDINV